MTAQRPRSQNSADVAACDLVHAPERTRTSTDHSVHKALNLNSGPLMLSRASDSSKLRGSADAMDALPGVDVATAVATSSPRGALVSPAGCGNCRDVRPR